MELVEARESPTKVFTKALDQPCFSWEVPSLLSDTQELCAQCLGPGFAAVLLRQTGRYSQSLCSSEFTFRLFVCWRDRGSDVS